MFAARWTGNVRTWDFLCLCRTTQREGQTLASWLCSLRLAVYTDNRVSPLLGGCVLLECNHVLLCENVQLFERLRVCVTVCVTVCVLHCESFCDYECVSVWEGTSERILVCVSVWLWNDSLAWLACIHTWGVSLTGLHRLHQHWGLMGGLPFKQDGSSQSPLAKKTCIVISCHWLWRLDFQTSQQFRQNWI